MDIDNKPYKTIGEVVKEISLSNKNKKLNTHTLRFWEKHLSKLNLKFLMVRDDIIHQRI